LNRKKWKGNLLTVEMGAYSKINKKEEENFKQEKLEGDLSFTLSIFFHRYRLKTNTQDGRRPIPPPLCPTRDKKKNWKMCKTPPSPLSLHQENVIESVL